MRPFIETEPATEGMGEVSGMERVRGDDEFEFRGWYWYVNAHLMLLAISC